MKSLSMFTRKHKPVIDKKHNGQEGRKECKRMIPKYASRMFRHKPAIRMADYIDASMTNWECPLENHMPKVYGNLRGVGQHGEWCDWKVDDKDRKTFYYVFSAFGKNCHLLGRGQYRRYVLPIRATIIQSARTEMVSRYEIQWEQEVPPEWWEEHKDYYRRYKKVKPIVASDLSEAIGHLLRAESNLGTAENDERYLNGRIKELEAENRRLENLVNKNKKIQKG